MKIHRGILQRSPEWFALRDLKMTGSHADTIQANGKGLETYVYEPMASHLSNSTEEGYMNDDMKRGVELEDEARTIYELENGVEVEEVGFIEADEHTGVSPDGLIGEDGGLEIKCPNDTNYYKLMLKGEEAILPKYLWQVQMSLLVSERKWWDLAFYSNNFKQSLLIFRIEPDKEKHERLTMGLGKGKAMLTEQLEIINKK